MFDATSSGGSSVSRTPGFSASILLEILNLLEAWQRWGSSVTLPAIPIGKAIRVSLCLAKAVVFLANSPTSWINSSA